MFYTRGRQYADCGGKILEHQKHSTLMLSSHMNICFVVSAILGRSNFLSLFINPKYIANHLEHNLNFTYFYFLEYVTLSGP